MVKTKADETKMNILRAARIEFAQDGFAATSVESIAKRAEVPKSLIFYYFNNKQELYRSLLRRILEHPEKKETLSFLTDPNLSIPVRLRLLIEHICESMAHLPETDKQIILWEMAEGRENMRSLASELFVPRLELAEELIKQGVQEGLFYTKDSLLFIWSLIAFVMFYNMQKETYAGTRFFKRLYQEREGNFFRDFAVNHFFAALGWPKKKKIPQIPKHWQEKLKSISCHHWEENLLSEKHP